VARAVSDGVALDYEDCGAGEPVVFIHGAFIADVFRPLLRERSLARYRLISYHRRGHCGSSRTKGATSLSEQAGDCRRLLSACGVRRAHVVGHSFGGAIALQLALDAPQLVHTLSLLEPGLIVGESAQLYRQGLVFGLERFREVGARVAVDEFLEMRWPEYQEGLERVLTGSFEQAVADAATWFESDLPAVLDSGFGEVEAREIAQPTLVVLGARSALLQARFTETYRLLLDWLPNGEGFVLDDAAHFLAVENPRCLAEALAGFYARHP
jgi:pimeloyl-ACP methyl ester carboxylesterase